MLPILFVLMAQPAHPRPGASPASAHGTDIAIGFTGDCTFGAVNGDGGGIRFPAVYRRSGQLDYPFHLVRRWFATEDLTVVNFECTLTNANGLAEKQWHFKGPGSFASIFPASSVDLAGLANNHSMDFGASGRAQTVAAHHPRASHWRL